MPGVEADISVGPIELYASLGTKLDEVNANLKKMQRLNFTRSRVPQDVRMFQSTTIGAAAPRTGISLGGPQAGFYWLVRRLIVGGVTFKTSAAGTAEVYITGLGGEAGAIVGPMISALGLTDLVDQATSLPNIAFYTNRQLIVQANENLMVVIDSGTASQVYTATCQVENHRTVSSDTNIID